MRTSITAILLILAGLTGASNAAAQAPAPPASTVVMAPPPPAQPPPATPPPASTLVVVVPPPASTPGPAGAAGAPGAAGAHGALGPPGATGTPGAPGTPGATGAPGAPGEPGATGAPGAPAPPPPGNWYDKFAADAFVDGYFALNFNFPKPAGQISPGSPIGGNAFRAFDTSQWFALNWAGVNASYTADPIGGTVGLRFGPGAIQYHAGTSDAVAGLQFVKQAYATWKAADKLTLDFGKFDQPFGSEVADSQLNMNYTRTLLFWYMQPLWFTGLRATIPVSDQLSILAFVANGWNNSVDINAGKAFGAQVMIKPADQFIAYLGYVGSPEQPDVGITPMTATMPMMAGDAHNEANWRHLVDLVLDINPTKELRILLNGDYRVEDNFTATHSAVAYGGNIVVRYSLTDAFYASLRGDYFHDEHGDVLGTGAKTDAEDVTLTLAYGIGNHLALMLDGRIDVFDNPYFYKNANLADTTKTQFTTTLGVIASTK